MAPQPTVDRTGDKHKEQQNIPVSSNWPSHLLPQVKPEARLPITPFQNLGPIASPSGITAVNLARPVPRMTMDYYGALNPERIVKKLAAFLVRNTNANLPEVKKTLHNFINITTENYWSLKRLQQPGTSSTPLGVFISLRLGKSEKFFKTIDWHLDRRLYAAKDEQINSIYCMAVLGNGTRVLPESNVANCVRFKGVLHLGEFLKTDVRQLLNKQPLLPVKCGDIIRFTWGEPDSPLHAGGKPDRDRVLLLAGCVWNTGRDQGGVCSEVSRRLPRMNLTDGSSEESVVIQHIFV